MTATTSEAALDGLLDAIEHIAIQPADVQAAGALIADAVACMVGAQTVEAAQPVVRWSREQPRSPQTSALTLGALSNVLEMDAMHVASSVHPGTVVVPAALAVAMALGSSGPALARAVLRGTEAAIRLGRSTGVGHRQRFQSTSTCGGTGAALACADLLGLTRAQSLDAMSNMANIAGGMWAFLDEDTLTKQWHAGKAASSAVDAAQLAAQGLRGPHHVLDSRRGFLAVLCDGGNPAELDMPQEHWQIHGTAYKPWPSPRPTHAAITTALEARRQIGAGAIEHRVERIVLRTYRMAVDLCNRTTLATAHDARFSLAYNTAVALATGGVDFASFEMEAISRHAPLAARVEVHEDPAMTAAYPQSSSASLEIWLDDGRIVVARADHALGDPELPLSHAARIAKHRSLLALGSISPESRLMEDIHAIGTGETSLAELLGRAFEASGLRFGSPAA